MYAIIISAILLLVGCDCVRKGSFNSSCNPFGECFCKPGFERPKCQCILEGGDDGTKTCMGKQTQVIFMEKTFAYIMLNYTKKFDDTFLFLTFAQQHVFPISF